MHGFEYRRTIKLRCEELRSKNRAEGPTSGTTRLFLSFNIKVKSDVISDLSLSITFGARPSSRQTAEPRTQPAAHGPRRGPLGLYKLHRRFSTYTLAASCR